MYTGRVEVSVRCCLCVSSLVLDECLVHLKEIWTGVNRSSTQRMNNNSVTFTSRMFVVKLGRLAQMFGAKQTQNIYILELWIKLHSYLLIGHWASVLRVVWYSWLTECLFLLTCLTLNIFVYSAERCEDVCAKKGREAPLISCPQLHASTPLAPGKTFPVARWWSARTWWQNKKEP